MMWGKFKSALQIGMMAAGLTAFDSMPSLAHDFNIGTLADPIEIGGIGADYTVQVNHQDEDPWKGWVNLTVTNTGS